MTLHGLLLTLIALPWRLWRKRRPVKNTTSPRILVLRRNRLGDMLCTLPFLRLLRRHYPQAHITVACDAPGAPIARACDAVNEVILLQPPGLFSAFANARQLQDYDWVIAAKGGFDRRLAFLARLTNAPVRIGLAHRPRGASAYYTHPVALPEKTYDEHQIETVCRLGTAIGATSFVFLRDSLLISIPRENDDFARQIYAAEPFARASRRILLNISSTVPLRFRQEDLVRLAQRLVEETGAAVGMVFAPADEAAARDIVALAASPQVVALPTPSTLDLAALFARAAFFITPEGGAAHLAAAVRAPTVVLWSEGPFAKWHSRGENQTFVRAERRQKWLDFDQVWDAVAPHLSASSGI